MLDGVVLLDKPAGPSSFRAVQMVSRILGCKKAGHAGTLDPMATGLLVVCLGRATKISRFIMDGMKQYVGTMRLGMTTDTYDSQGRIIDTAHLPPGLGVEDIRRAASAFTGTILQSPPAFSAAKHKGVPLYRLARRGLMVKKEPRTIEVMEFEVEDAGIPCVDFRITCSKGTYVRSLVHELGRKLECGAHMTALRRTRCGNLVIEKAFTMEDLEDAVSNGGIRHCIMDVSHALSHLPTLSIENGDARRIRLGQRIESTAFLNALKSVHDSCPVGAEKFVRLVTCSAGKETLVAVAGPPVESAGGMKLKTEKVWV